ATQLEPAFHEAVDSYLEFCKEQGTEPNQSFKGSFNVRVGPELHRRAVIEAKKRGISLNELVTVALERIAEDDLAVHSARICSPRSLVVSAMCSSVLRVAHQVHLSVMARRVVCINPAIARGLHGATPTGSLHVRTI